MDIVLAHGAGESAKDIAKREGCVETQVHQWARQWAQGKGRWTATFKAARGNEVAALENVKVVKASKKAKNVLDEQALYEMIGRQAVLIARLRGERGEEGR